MKQLITDLIRQSLTQLESEEKLPKDAGSGQIHLERTRQKSHGDFATNIALGMAKKVDKNPIELAEQIIGALPASDQITKVEIAGPGFINFFVTEASSLSVINDIIAHGEDYGRNNLGCDQRITVEYVSANPTGPLHVGHGRGAAFGDSLSRLLSFSGYRVHREYYFNDAGRQMDILALSVWLRYLEQLGVEIDYPENCYQGEYIIDIAARIAVKFGNDFNILSDDLFVTGKESDAEQHLDQLIENMRGSLGDQSARDLLALILDFQIKQIQDDLHEFRVDFDEWFSEGALQESGAIAKAVEKLQNNGHIYECDGALWFRASAFGDEKDRVVIRKNGRHTYFAADIAYMVNKVERGFERLIYVFGADHHGTVARMKAAFQALGYDLERFTIVLVQMASLYRNGKRVSMSTRRGEYVTLEELRDDVGVDATRFFYSMRRNEQQMDFDLDLAKSQSNENPVYYVQYAHARVSSIFSQAQGKQIQATEHDQIDLGLLNHELERDLAVKLAAFPELIASSAKDLAPHQVTYYLRELAALFHSYYNRVKVLDADEKTCRARLALIASVRQVLRNGLSLIGVSAPDYM